MAAGLVLLTAFVHMPFLPARVAALALDQPSMDLRLRVRATAIALRVIGSVLGFFTGLANVMDQPARQSFVAEMVGKNDTLVWGGVFPFGAFLVGAMSEGWGVSMALLVNGTAGLAGLAAILAWWRRRAPARAG